jgi:hypothetical protein
MSDGNLKTGYYWVNYSGVWIVAELEDTGKWYAIAESMWINDHIKEVGKYLGSEGNKSDASDKPSINHEPLLSSVFNDKELHTIAIDTKHIIKHVTLNNAELGKRTRITKKIRAYFKTK